MNADYVDLRLKTLHESILHIVRCISGDNEETCVLYLSLLEYQSFQTVGTLEDCLRKHFVHLESLYDLSTAIPIPTLSNNIQVIHPEIILVDTSMYPFNCDLRHFRPLADTTGS